MKPNRDRLKIFLVGLWVVFTVTLTGWWLVFGLRQLDRLNQLHLEQAVELQRHSRMLMWEGGVLIASLLGGGIALFYYARREQKRHAQVEEFFAAFTHDAKTAMASLRLQAESLREDLAQAAPNTLLDRLLQDTLRLQLQLENSLFLVNPAGQLFMEPIRLSRLVDALRHHWPALTINQSGDGVLMVDARALESVLTNLVQNAVTHGQASVVDITVEDSAGGGVSVRIVDNGCGFVGDHAKLGELFVRHARGSGSGVGLYIAKQLMRRMNSTLKFAAGTDRGFAAELSFPGGPVEALEYQPERGMA